MRSRDKDCVALCLHFPTYIDGVVLNTWTASLIIKYNNNNNNISGKQVKRVERLEKTA